MNFVENHNQDRNKNEDASLQQVEARVLRARNNSLPETTFFQNKLKQQLLEKRASKKASMNPFTSFFKNRRPSPKRSFAAVFALLLIVVISATYFNQGGKNIFISPVYAEDNFEVTATSGDALAVQSNTHFIVKSKVAIDTDDLKKSLSLTPNVPFAIEKKSPHEFEVVPQEGLKERGVYNLKIDYAYVNDQKVTVERDYSFAFQVKNQLKVMSSLPGKNTSKVPLTSGIEVTFSSDSVSGFENAFRIEPAVEGKFEKHNRTYVFVPKALAPSQIYTVTVSKNVQVQGANPMAEDYVFRFETESANKNESAKEQAWGVSLASPFFEFGSNQTVLVPIWTSASGGETEGNYMVRAFAFSSFDEFFAAVKNKDYTPNWAVETSKKQKVDTKTLNKVAEYNLKPQAVSYDKYLVLPGNLSKGFYVIEVEKDGISSQILLNVSNLATFVDITDNKTLVWVNNLLTKKPHSGAVVQKIDSRVTQNTNAQGVAEFNTVDFLEPVKSNALFVPPEYFTVKTADDTMLVRVYNYSGSYFDYYSQPISDKYWKHTGLDRGLYQPNDTVRFWGFVKPRQEEAQSGEITVGLLPPSSWRWYAENEEESYVLQTKTKMNEFGVFEGKMELDHVSPGYYTVVFKKGDEVLQYRYIEIQRYAKPAYTLSLSTPKRAVYAGESIPFSLKSEFFEGTPVVNLNVAYSGTESGTLTTNEKGEASFVGKTSVSSCTVELGCNHAGSFSLSVNPVRSEEADIRDYEAVSVLASHVSTDVDLISVNKTTMQVSSTVYAQDLARYNDDNYDWNRSLAVAPGKKLVGLVRETSYVKIETGEYYDFINKKNVKTYTYDRVEKDHVRFDGVSDEKGHYTFDFVVDPEKTYEVRMLVEDGFGAQDFSINYYYSRYGLERSGNFTWYSLRDAASETHPNGYNIGEKVMVDVFQNEKKLENPTGAILFYRLQNGIQDYAVSTVPTYSFTFTDAQIPNVGIGGTYFDGKTYNSLTQEGTSLIKYNTDQRKLNVNIQTGKEEYKPGEQATLSISTTDAKNSGHPSTVNISVIDEAYFAVGSSGAENPLINLYSYVSLGEKYSYTTHNYTRLDRFGGAEKGCFLPGTKIKMADGTEKNIEDIRVGDMISTFENSLSKELVSGKVVKLQQHMVPGYLVINDHLRVTPEHRMFINGKWQMAGHAQIGDTLRNANNEAVVITSLQKKYSMVKVYNFEVENYHTYFADGVWVHNDKGDGAPRVDFPDVALFKTVQTDVNGKATVTFKLPDNITSWRITAQAVSTDLYGGETMQKFPVSLPLFAHANIQKELLIGDEPLLTVTAFGKALKKNDEVSGTVQSPFVQSGQTKISGTAYVPIRVPFSAVSVGNYAVTTSVAVGQYKDTLVQKFEVVSSRLTRSIAVPIGDGAAVVGGKLGNTKFVVTDAGRGRLYPDVVTFACGCGDRIDQRIGLNVSLNLMQKYFGQKEVERNLPDLTIYQSPEGGIRLLPYASADLELSAKVASVAPEIFDEERLAQYFYSFLTDGKEGVREEIVWALYGLSSLHEPVLPSVRNLSARTDLAPNEKLLVGLSLAELGDHEAARAIYRNLLAQNGERVNVESVKIKIGNTPDEVVQNTGLMAGFGAMIGEKDVEQLYEYTKKAPKKDVLVNLEKLMFLKHFVPSLPSSEGEVTVTINGKSQVVKLQNGYTEEFTVAKAALGTVQFTNKKGSVSIMSVYDVPLQDVEIAPTNFLGIDRKYFVDGKETTTFHEGDLVEIRITPSIKQSMEGQYEVIDVLPAGLKNIANPYMYNAANKCTTQYPFEVDGQVVKFLVYRSTQYYYGCNGHNYFSYFARVSSPGNFKTDNVLIQSFDKPEYLNFSGAGKTISIKP